MSKILFISIESWTKSQGSRLLQLVLKREFASKTILGRLSLIKEKFMYSVHVITGACTTLVACYSRILYLGNVLMHVFAYNPPSFLFWGFFFPTFDMFIWMNGNCSNLAISLGVYRFNSFFFWILVPLYVHGFNFSDFSIRYHAVNYVINHVSCCLK